MDPAGWTFLILGLAIGAEVTATLALKAAEGFTRPGPTVIVALGYGTALWLMSTSMDLLPIGVVYAIWSGVGMIGAALGAWLIGGAAIDIWQRAGREAIRLTRLPRADWGKAVAHAGFGITIAGIAGMLAWEAEDIRVAQVGQPFTVADYQITLQSVDEVEGPNYLAEQGRLTVRPADDRGAAGGLRAGACG